MSNMIAKIALKQLVSFMKEKNINSMKVYINDAGEIDFIPAIAPEDFILKSEHEAKINELKNYFKTIKK